MERRRGDAGLLGRKSDEDKESTGTVGGRIRVDAAETVSSVGGKDGTKDEMGASADDDEENEDEEETTTRTAEDEDEDDEKDEEEEEQGDEEDKEEEDKEEEKDEISESKGAVERTDVGEVGDEREPAEARAAET